MKHSAIFKIETSFNLTTIGVTLLGQIIEGKILPGYFSVIVINEQQAKVKIKGLDMGRPDENGIMKWGLILEFEDASLENIAKSDRIKEQTIVVYSGRE